MRDYELSNCRRLAARFVLSLPSDGSPEDFYKRQRRERRVPLEAEADAVGGRLAAVSRDESCQTQFAGKIMFG